MAFMGDMGRRVGSGLLGAAALTATHELARRIHPAAPRMDQVGIPRAEAGLPGPRPPAAARAGALRDHARRGSLSNGLYYGALLWGRPRHPWLRAMVGGTLAGAGAAWLPPRLGLARRRRTRLLENGAMTVGMYLLGAVVAAALYRQTAAGRRPRSAASRAMLRRWLPSSWKI